MDTKIIELRMAVRALPTSNRLVSLAVKSEVLRLSELLNSQYAAQQSVQADEGDSHPPVYVFSVRDLSTKKADTKPALHR